MQLPAPRHRAGRGEKLRHARLRLGRVALSFQQNSELVILAKTDSGEAEGDEALFHLVNIQPQAIDFQNAGFPPDNPQKPVRALLRQITGLQNAA